MITVCKLGQLAWSLRQRINVVSRPHGAGTAWNVDRRTDLTKFQVVGDLEVGRRTL